MCVGGESRHLDAMSGGKGTVGFYKEMAQQMGSEGMSEAVVTHGRGHFGCLENDGGVEEFVQIVLKAVGMQQRILRKYECFPLRF